MTRQRGNKNPDRPHENITADELIAMYDEAHARANVLRHKYKMAQEEIESQNAEDES